MNAPNNTDELKVLFPGRVIQVAGEEILIQPFKLTQIPRVAAIVAKFYRNGANEALDIGALITSGGEDIFDLLCLSTGKDRAWLDELSGEDGVALLTAIIEENADFFSRKLAPALTGLTARLTDAAGVKSSLN